MKADEPENEIRRRSEWVWKSTLGGIFFWPVLVAVTIYSFFAEPVDPWFTPYLLVGLCVVTAGVLAYACYREYYRAIFEYTTIGGIRWAFQGKAFYSAPERMRRFELILGHNLLNGDIGATNEDIYRWFKTVGVTVIDSDLPEFYGKDPAGLTTRRTKHSIVEGPYSRDLGTTGWEILLQLFPNFAPEDNMTESAKESWMRSKGILPLETPEGVKHPKDEV